MIAEGAGESYVAVLSEVLLYYSRGHPLLYAGVVDLHPARLQRQVLSVFSEGHRFDDRRSQVNSETIPVIIRDHLPPPGSLRLPASLRVRIMPRVSSGRASLVGPTARSRHL